MNKWNIHSGTTTNYTLYMHYMNTGNSDEGSPATIHMEFKTLHHTAAQAVAASPNNNATIPNPFYRSDACITT